MGFFGVKKRHPYPSGQRSYGAKAIIERVICLSPIKPLLLVLKRAVDTI